MCSWEKFWQIGKKLRDGEFGACFVHPKDKSPLVYSARPGSRIWEADTNGNVVSTHQFKRVLATPSIPICGPGLDPVFTHEDSYPAQSVSFSKLLPLSGQYLISWTNKAIYILDSSTISVVVWTNDVQDVHQIGVHKTDIYCLFQDSSVRKLTLYPVEKCIAKLTAKQLWLQSAKLCCYFQTALIPSKARKYLPVTMVTEIKDHLQNDEEYVEKLSEMVSKLETCNDDRSSTTSSRRSSVSSCDGIIRMNSGIYQVHGESRTGDSDNELEVELWQTSEEGAFVENTETPTIENFEQGVNNHFNHVELVAHGTMAKEDTGMLNKIEDLQAGDIETWVNNNQESELEGSITSRKESEDQKDVTVETKLSNVPFGNSGMMGNEGNAVCKTLSNSESKDTDLGQVTMVSPSMHHNSIIPVHDQSAIPSGQEEKGEEKSTLQNEGTHENGFVRVGIDRDELTMTEITLEHKDVVSDTETKHAADETVADAMDAAVAHNTGDTVAINEDSNVTDRVVSKIDIAQTALESTETTVPDTPTSGVEHNDNVVIAVSVRPTTGSKKKKRKKKKISAPEITAQKDKFDTISINSTSSIDSLQDVPPGKEWSSLPPSLSQSPTENSLSSTFHGNMPGSSSSLGSSSPPSKPLIAESISKSSPTLKRSNLQSTNPSSRFQESDAPVSSAKDVLLMRRSSEPTGEHVRNSSPSRSISVPASSHSQSSSASTSPLPSPTSSPTHHSQSVESMVRHMGVPFYTGGPAGSQKLSPFHVPSLSEMKDSISSKLSKTKVLLQQSVQNTGIFVDRPEMTVPKLKDLMESDQETENAQISSESTVEEASLIDYTDLIEATKTARASLDNLTDLLNVGKVKEILVTWISHLEDAQEKIIQHLASIPETEYHGQMKELYTLSPEHKTHITELATMCLDLEIFSSQKLRTDITRSNKQTEGSVETVSMVTEGSHIGKCDNASCNDKASLNGECISIAAPTTSNNVILVAMETDQLEETRQLQDVLPEDSEKDLKDGNYCDLTEADVAILESTDSQSAKFIHKYSYWLDLERVQKMIGSWEGSKDESWFSLISILQEHTKDCELPQWVTEVDYHKVKSQITTAIPFNYLIIYMDRLFKNNPDVGIEFSIDRHPTIQPWQVWIMCNTHQDGLQLFIFYVRKLLKSANRDTILNDLCSDDWVRGQMVNYLLSQDAPEDQTLLACQCGMPRPGSYQYLWTNQTLLDAVIAATLNDSQREDLLAICQKYSYWPGYITLSCDLLPKTTWLQYVVQLGDVHLLEDVLSDEAKVTFTLDAWEYLLQLFQQFYQSKDTCLWSYNCLQCRSELDPGQGIDDISLQPTLTWQSLAKLMMRSTSPQTMLKLVQPIGVPSGAFNNEFYQSCIMTAIIEHHQK
ncbi:uncharacterized protein LOC144452547 [Glandiceps talaboti]